MQLRKLLTFVFPLLVFGYPHICRASEVSPALTTFMNKTVQYKLNAPWVMDELMKMNLHEFSAAWAYVVSVMTDPAGRWRFFSDTPQGYNDDSYMPQWIWQCHFFELWLSKVYVKIEDLSIVYDEKNAFASMPQHYVHIFACWHTLTEHGQGDFSAIYDFYAFYADCLVHCLLRGIKVAYLEMDTPLYDTASSISFSLSEGLKIMVRQLQNSDYAPRYSAQLSRYAQVLELLKHEKIGYLLKNM